jgi:hypothetical protein
MAISMAMAMAMSIAISMSFQSEDTFLWWILKVEIITIIGILISSLNSTQKRLIVYNFMKK